LSEPRNTSIEHSAAAGRPGTTSFSCTKGERGLVSAWFHTSGALTGHAASQLQQTLLEAQEESRLVVLDLRRLTSIDAAGIAVMLEADEASRAQGGQLVLLRPSARVLAALARVPSAADLMVVESASELSFDPRDLGRLDVSIDTIGGEQHADVVVCRGEIDTATAPLLRDTLASLAVGDVVVDLRSTTFMDSTGLSTLLNALRRLTRQDRRLVVVCPEGAVRHTIRISGLIETFGVAEDVDAARTMLAR
jgi:anti-anti-sigma factor